MERTSILDDPLFIYLKQNQSAWGNAYNEQKRKYRYEKQKNEKRRAREKKEAALKIEVIEAIEENK